jgi:hypothetical protein
MERIALADAERDFSGVVGPGENVIQIGAEHQGTDFGLVGERM